MNLFRWTFFVRGRAIAAAATIAALLGCLSPLGVLAQDGVVTQQPSQPAPSQRPVTPPSPNTRQQQEKAGEQGGTNTGIPTEREKHGLPAPGSPPVTEPGAQNQQTTPGSQTQPPASTITQPLAMSPEIGPERVGVDLSQNQLMTLQDAVALALQNNLDIEQFRQGVQVAQYSLFSFRGAYDITSTSDVNYNSQTIPVATIFSGGGATGSLTQNTINWNFTTFQNLQKTGGFWEVDFTNSRLNTTSSAATLTSQYLPTLTFRFTQPLMRNLSIDANRHNILVAQRQLDLTDSQFRQRVIEIINAVQDAYWELYYAIRAEAIARNTVELARVQLENNRRQVEAGTAAPIDLRSTEAALETDKGNVIIALQGITTAENNLKNLLLKNPDDKLWNAPITPTDKPQFNQPVVSLDEARAQALKNRPELEQLKLQSEQKDLDIKYFRNQTKPQVDFTGFYSNTGLAGTPSALLSQSGGFSALDTGLISNLNLALAASNLPPFNPTAPSGGMVPSQFVGGYGQALRDLFGFQYHSFQFGVHFSFPWRNRTAEGNLGQALAQSRQLDAQLRKELEQVQVDVRNALQNVVATKQRWEAAQAGRIAAEAQLAGENEKFRAGLSTNFFVLQRQNDLAVAEGTEARAAADYSKALADLQRFTGTTLVNNNVQVTSIAKGGGR